MKKDERKMQSTKITLMVIAMIYFVIWSIEVIRLLAKIYTALLITQ